jgi:protein SCO1/2
MRCCRGIVAIALLLTGAGTAFAQPAPATDNKQRTTDSVSATQPNVAIPDELRDVGIDEKLGAQIPLGLVFENEKGEQVKLGEYFKPGRPVILQLGYMECPMLCGLVSQGVVKVAKEMDLRGGKDYEFIFLSINPSERAQLAYLKKQSYMQELGRPGEADGWHFLVGNEKDIRHVADAAGWKYKWVESARQFAHPSNITILSPEGKVMRYIYGVDYDPKTVRWSLVEASQGKIGTTADQLLLICFHYDPKAGAYSLAALNLMRLGGVLTVIILAGVIWRLIRKERARHAPEAQ